ncbi:DUF6340 family protein [Mariniphaga sp.]|uniref:DUF6340 family protein n=1 Tax=Mariniphaga sp. TaxID=1954475 RepID=UPI00356A25A4
MKTSLNLALLVFTGISFFGCNTLYNTKTIGIEIFVPGKAIFPEKYDTIAIRFNNFNSTYNSNFAEYFENNKRLVDTTNTDSAAAEIYFDYFLQTLKANSYFNSIFEIERADYSKFILSDSLLKLGFIESEDSLNSLFIPEKYKPAANFWSLAGRFQPQKENSEVKYLDPELGLYSKEELTQLADSTHANLLLSLDYFTTIDRKSTFNEQSPTGVLDVFVISYWNFYDLNNLMLTYYYDRVDTLTYDYIEGIEILPPREEAIQIAAEISGSQFATFLVPHWIEVQRMYYGSGQIDLKKTDQLVTDEKWLEAAEIWKQHVKNPNKKIAAKSMFNMALACEMLGQLDAAVDWAVQSYHVFGQKNPLHEQNCLDYINILSQRKLDIKRIEYQFDPELIPSK